MTAFRATVDRIEADSAFPAIEGRRITESELLAAWTAERKAARANSRDLDAIGAAGIGTDTADRRKAGIPNAGNYGRVAA